MTGLVVVGREVEIAHARARLRDTGQVCLWGPAGIGKSTVGRAVAGAERLGVAGATASLAAVPRGALLAALDLGPATPAPTDAVELALALRACHPRGLLIDDAQWLDDASVPVLQIAVRRGMRLALTCRTGTALSPAIVELVDGGRLEIGPLGTEHLTAMVEGLLHAPLDHAVARWFQRLSGGNPLLARELAVGARRAGALIERQGLLTAEGPLPVGGEVVDIVRERLNAAPADVRDLIGLLALEEPLGLTVLRAVSSLETADAAERLGLVTLRGEPAQAWLGHPLYGEVAAADATGAERVRGYERLVAATDAHPATAVDLVRRTRWAVAAELPVAVDDLLAASRQASPALAERFLRRACEAGAGLPATLALAGLLGHVHRGEEAVALLAEAQPESPEEQIQLAVTRAFALSFGPQRPDEAIEVVADVEARLGPHPWLTVARSVALFRWGHIRRALELSQDLVSQPLPDPARAQVALTLQSCLFHSGRIGAGRALNDEVARLVRAAAADVPEGPGAARLLEAWALRLHGDLPGERRMAEAEYAAALEEGDEGLRGQFAQLLGSNHVACGRAETGSRYLRESLAGRGVWLDTTRPWVLALLVQAQVVAGQLDAARLGLADLRTQHRTLTHDPDVASAEAAVLAAQGDRRRAIGVLVPAGRAAYELGLVVPALQCWYDAVRYGSSEGARLLARHARELDSTWAVGYERRARADDGAALEEAAATWAALGHVWFAADSWAAAVRWYRSHRQDASATRARLALSSLLVDAEPIPSLTAERVLLTERETQVVELAIAGLADRDIAERLGISIRTVQTHLGHSYAKLGVRSRRELRP